MEAFQRSGAVDAIVLVVGSGDEAYGKQLAAEYGLSKVVAVVAGGAERQHSVRRGIDALTASCPSVQWVLVHDAARCLTPAGVFGRVVDAVRHGAVAVVPGVPVVDTIKVVVFGKGAR